MEGRMTISNEPETHDYEPGEDTHPMHTDPLCRVCGQPKRSSAHE